MESIMTLKEAESIIKNLQIELLSVAALAAYVGRNLKSKDPVDRHIADLLLEKIEEVAAMYK
jgi:hypothetical protein